jgi:hypothetical protein
MKIVKGYNEYKDLSDFSLNGSDKNRMGDNEITDDETAEIKKLASGEINQIDINGFKVSIPSELDGKSFLVINQEGKHHKIPFGDDSSSVSEAEGKVLDIIKGITILESKRYKK